MRLAASSALLASLLLLPAHGEAQTSPEEQARRLLEDGRAYWTKGQYKQALDNFNTIISGFSGSESVDDALLEIGRYALEVEGNAARARESFDTVAKRYPQSDSAPGAYYYLGWLALTQSQKPEDIDDALAQFTRVQRLYPRSDWVPQALHASGLAERKVGRYPEAVDAQRRVVLEYPASPAAAAAQFEIGHCLTLLGEPRLAMEEFQKVRNGFPESPWAAQALERTTELYRLYEGSRPAFRLDSGFAIGSGDALKDVRAILMTPARTLWIASDKVRAALSYDAGGRPSASLAGQDLSGLSLTPGNEIVVAARAAVRVGPRDIKTLTIPGEKPGSSEPLEKITAALVLPGGEMLVADEKRKRVLRFAGEPLAYQGTFPDGREREVRRLVSDSEGAIVLLDQDAKSVQVFDARGRAIRTLGPKGPGYELRRPVDVAVDHSRNLYVADEELGVLLLAPDGRLLTMIGGEEARKPRALTLEPGGALLVYSDKAQRILRYR
jgi:TolA-binding protein